MKISIKTSDGLWEVPVFVLEIIARSSLVWILNLSGNGAETPSLCLTGGSREGTPGNMSSFPTKLPMELPGFED